MNHTPARGTFYLLATVVPLLASVVAFVIELFLHPANISLIYLLGVLIVAVRTSAGPALLCAVMSFLAYNYFFTEPRYTLVMMHREDILTVGFFMLMAVITGHQATRLRQQLLNLEKRTTFVRDELEFLGHLAGAIEWQQVFDILGQTLPKVVGAPGFIVDREGVRFPSDGTPVAPAAGVQDVITGMFELKAAVRRFTVVGYHLYTLHDGQEVVAVAGYPIHREGIGIGDDLTESLMQQASLALARIRLARELERERVEKDKELLRSALLTSVSHDLRTPLSSMIGSASTLMELGESLSDDQKHELLEAILSEAGRLDGYIQNLLDMTRLGYGDMKLERDWISVEEILGAVIRRIKSVYPVRHIVMDIANDLPLLFVHAALIEQALYNVVENAIKYSPADSTVGLLARLYDRQMIVDVTDEGPGIPVSERERVFDMFHTVHKRDRHAAGTGLGLAICRGMIGAHGGSVSIVDNNSGTGTTFRISLPLNEYSGAGGEES